jgi:large subunit ribosomal protein L35
MKVKIKQRTHKGAAKRFKITGSGKILHRAQNARHLISNKSKKQMRRLKQMKQVVGRFEIKIRKLLALA